MSKKVWRTLAVAGVATAVYKYWQSTQQNGSEPKEAWDVADMPDLTGKVAIVTGANSGIGFEAAKALAQKGAHVVMACRNMEKGHNALVSLKQADPSASVEVMELDLSSLQSVRAFADAFKQKHDRLDILVNNAGIMMVPYGATEDGFEQQMGTNHLGHFALTGLLYDLIKQTPGARVVSVSSNGHRMGDTNWEKIMYKEGREYSPIRAYGRSKLANLLFTQALQRRFDQDGVDAIATAAHPGGSNTNLAAHLQNEGIGQTLFPLFESFMQGADMGALPTLRAAVDPNANGGDYYGPQGMMQISGHPVKVQANNAAYNALAQQQLWDISEKLTGVTFGS